MSKFKSNRVENRTLIRKLDSNNELFKYNEFENRVSTPKLVKLKDLTFVAL